MKQKLPKLSVSGGFFHLWIRGRDWEKKQRAIQEGELVYVLHEHAEELAMDIYAQLTNYEHQLAWEISLKNLQTIKNALGEIPSAKTVHISFVNFETGIKNLVTSGSRESVVRQLFTNPGKLDGKNRGYGFNSDFVRCGETIFRCRLDRQNPVEQQRVKIPKKIELAIVFLIDLLKDGPVDAAEAMDQARQAGLTTDSIFRARQALGVEVISRGRQGSVWQRPTRAITQEVEVSQIPKLKT